MSMFFQSCISVELLCVHVARFVVPLGFTKTWILLGEDSKWLYNLCEPCKFMASLCYMQALYVIALNSFMQSRMSCEGKCKQALVL